MKTNTHLQTLIQDLRRQSIEQNVNIWKRVAGDLSKSSRRRRIVSLLSIARHTKENDTVVVPGKVLGDGDLPHKLTVAAWGFSTSAEEKLKGIGATLLSIDELMKQNPQGKNVRILG